MDSGSQGASPRPFLPPPTHPSLRNAHLSPAAYAMRRVPPRPTPPPRPAPEISATVTASSSALDVRPVQSEPTTPGTLEHEPSGGTDPEGAEQEEKDEEELSEVQLRELYDDEEIERFLRLFSAYVREAKVAHPSENASQKGNGGEDFGQSSQSEHAQGVDIPGGDEDVESEEWVELDESRENVETPPPLPPRPSADRSLSEWIVMDYVLPLLPPQPSPPPAFTVRRLYLTAERLYLATIPVYGHLAKRLMRLATWEDKNTSLLYCAAYWFLWYQNFLLPALVLRITYSLIRRKLLPYPNLQELHEHRHDVERAKEFSATVAAQLVAAPTYDVQDAWRLAHDFYRSRKQKRAARDGGEAGNPVGDDNTDESDVKPEEHMPSKDVDSVETDIKRELLAAFSYIADLHERIKNTFLWRRPTSSLLYGVALFFAFLVTLLPARYLSKLLGLALGIVFWHVVPIVIAIPPSRRVKYPPLFNDVPTDADYAMELISQRVARGLDVKPKSRRPRPGSLPQEADRLSVGTIFGEGSVRSLESYESSRSGMWQKWANRMDTSKNIAKDAKNLLKDGQWKRPGNWLALNPLAAKVAMPGGSSEPRLQTYTFPAQYRMASGLITLTPDALFFTPLLSSTAKVAVPSDAISSIKRTSPMRGLNVCWMRHSNDGQDEERVEKFLWVGDRDELFARLVAWGGHRWMNV
ncbi:hypothetical protein DAEQUDRAFT_731786 [Daedalea quercina L-15889]|uniref:Uncharacterized protein n=1 Tax=Daedalea quercina L-15889 TaxID=1314783 RepID=A0A165M2L1_9APHY|nr:hypothetical protein DAEQUDRAFT_731786 [Daedalea quercina L-15889]